MTEELSEKRYQCMAWVNEDMPDLGLKKGDKVPGAEQFMDGVRSRHIDGMWDCLIPFSKIEKCEMANVTLKEWLEK